MLAAVGVYHMSRAALTRRAPADTLMVALVAPALVYFAVHSLHARVQANWLAPLYPLLAIAAAVALRDTVPARNRLAVGGAAAGLGLAMTALIYAHAVHPLDAGRLNKDPTQQMRGWGQLARDLDRMRAASGRRGSPRRATRQRGSWRSPLAIGSRCCSSTSASGTCICRRPRPS